ncbi:hypothetical protein NIES2101_18455 [Calothrix sp. HK-06]|nr:hypothetical protein NIES2101_18455 [Calothrix sp. HK-06]
MENTLSNWLSFTKCNELFTQSDYNKLKDEAYWKYYDVKNQKYINPEDNQNWVTGQFYQAPNTDIDVSQDLAILRFLNYALDI